MSRTYQKLISIVVLVSFSSLLLCSQGFADTLSVKLIINPNKTNVDAGSDPIALTAQASGTNLKYEWKLVGPGSIEGTGPAIFYVVPETVDKESAQAIVTVIITDDKDQETSESVTFNIIGEKPSTPEVEPESEKGMSRNTKIALGVGAAALVGGGIALVAGGGGDGDGGDEETLSVSGDWEFSGLLSQNTCEFSAAYSIEGTLTFVQSGTNVTIPNVRLSLIEETTLYFSYAGTVRGNDINLAATDPYVYQSGRTVIHIGSGIDVQNIENNSGSGSLNITGACIEGCTGSCQTIWSGIWTRVNW